jgi:hypothetical protein
LPAVGYRFNRQSEAEANKKYQPLPAATRRRAKLLVADGFLVAERMREGMRDNWKLSFSAVSWINE